MAQLITNIKEYRKQQGISQEKLAEEAGVRRETIIRLEQGRYNPSLKLAMDICRILNARVEDVFFFQEDDESGR